MPRSVASALSSDEQGWPPYDGEGSRHKGRLLDMNGYREEERQRLGIWEFTDDMEEGLDDGEVLLYDVGFGVQHGGDGFAWSLQG